MKAYAKFRDVGGIKSSTWFRDMVNSINISAVQTFAAYIKALSNAALEEYGLIRSYGFDVGIGGTAPATSNVKNKARLHFNYINANGETKTLALWIPSPDMTIMENVDGVGYRVLRASGEAIRDALRTMTGITNLEFSVGVLDYSESKNDARNSNCIECVDYVGNRDWMVVPQPISQAALETFAQFIDAYTTAILGRGIYVTVEQVVLASTDPLNIATTDDNGMDSVERRCVCKLAYVEGTQRKFMTMGLPAPLSANMVQGKDKRGYSLDVAIGRTLSINLTAMYGSANRSTTFVRGHVAYSDLDNQ